MSLSISSLRKVGEENELMMLKEDESKDYPLLVSKLFAVQKLSLALTFRTLLRERRSQQKTIS